uniref:Uncharacterized protein n=1 Tax=Candidatus Kentrum sp. MB TaxID=2138164 RepID=A0A450X1J9_9GAMM|nr:MAG: hypothetical protein BECKMB1821G_GA0114241_100414 [Candidatus Kentron sp. MB]
MIVCMLLRQMNLAFPERDYKPAIPFGKKRELLPIAPSLCRILITTPISSIDWNRRTERWVTNIFAILLRFVVVNNGIRRYWRKSNTLIFFSYAGRNRQRNPNMSKWNGVMP